MRWCFMRGPRNGNAGKWVVVNDTFTDVCDIYFMSCIWYLWSFHFHWPAHVLYLSWPNTQFLRDRSEICFWNSLARLMSGFRVEVWIYIFVSYATKLVSCNVIINMELNGMSVAFTPPTTSPTYPGATTLRSMITLNRCANINSKCNAVVHMYW